MSATIKIGDKSFVLTAMRISERKKAMQIAEELQALVKNGQFDAQICGRCADLALSMIHASILRAAPAGITREEIEDALSDEELMRAFQTLCAISAESISTTFGANNFKN
jgi:uncharacterized protein YigA (DUF484 family)